MTKEAMPTTFKSSEEMEAWLAAHSEPEAKAAPKKEPASKPELLSSKTVPTKSTKGRAKR